VNRFSISDFGFSIGRSDSKKVFCLAFGALLLAFALPAEAQQPPKVHRIGYLSASARADHAPSFEAFQLGLRELGYVEGKNIIIEARFAEGQAERLPELVAELVRLKVVSSSRAGRRLSAQPRKPLKQYPSLSPTLRIRLAKDLLRAWHVRGETLPG
jgi:hypothetical protein